MKRILYLGLIVIALAAASTAQVFSGCSSCSAGCPSQCPREPSHPTHEGGGGNSGGNTNSGPSEAEIEASRRARHEAAVERKEHQQFQKLLQRQDSEETAQKWLDFYQHVAGWPAAYYNYAITMWHLGHTEVAKGAFLWLMTNCPDYDKSICTDSRKHIVSIFTTYGTEEYKQGHYTTAEIYYKSAAQFVPAFDYDRSGDWTTTGMNPYPWYDMSFAESALHKWDEAFASANEAAKRTRVTGDPDRQPMVIRFYETYEQVQFAKAVTAIQSPATMDKVEVLRTLQNGVRYDTITGNPSYNARALIAQMWHQLGNDDLAEKEADIALLQHPAADPNTDSAQLVLDTIHADQLLTACEMVAKEDPSTTCVRGGAVVYQEETHNLQVLSAKIRHWDNQCTTITNDSEHPDDARYLNCH